MMTGSNLEMRDCDVAAYLKRLVNSTFKILPLREHGDSATAYMLSLQRELYGVQQLLPSIGADGRFITLMSILQYQIDNPECEIAIVRSEIFRAISLLDKMREQIDRDQKEV